MATVDVQTGLSRFRIVNSNQMIAPGKCAVCGAFSHGTFIDFGFELDYYGVVYICIENCFKELANLQDYYSPAQHKMAMAELEAKRFELNEALDKIEILERIVNDLRNIGYDNPTPVSNPVPQPSNPQPVAVPTGVMPKSAKPKSRSAKPANEQGHPGVLTNDELEGLIGPGFSI